jgi:hypothetical protein
MHMGYNFDLKNDRHIHPHQRPLFKVFTLGDNIVYSGEDATAAYRKSCGVWIHN